MNSLVACLGKLSLQNVAGVKARSISSVVNQTSLLVNPTLGSALKTGILCPGHCFEASGLLAGSAVVTSKLISDLQVRYRRVFKTRSRRFPGHVDIYGEEDGTREPLAAAEERFKRLDWGVYIKTK